MDTDIVALVGLAVIAGVFAVLAWVADYVWPWYEEWIDKAVKRDALKGGKSK